MGVIYLKSPSGKLLKSSSGKLLVRLGYEGTFDFDWHDTSLQTYNLPGGRQISLYWNEGSQYCDDYPGLICFEANFNLAILAGDEDNTYFITDAYSYNYLVQGPIQIFDLGSYDTYADWYEDSEAQNYFDTVESFIVHFGTLIASMTVNPEEGFVQISID
jgi:hypothetical protein